MRDPAVAVTQGPPRGMREHTADDDRQPALRRFRPGHHRRESDDIAAIFRLRLGPDLTHRLDLLAHPLEARRIDRAVILHLILVPAAADPEQEAATRDLVQRGDSLRKLDRVALDHKADAGSELELFGYTR